MQIDITAFVIGLVAGTIGASVALLIEVVAVSKTEKYAKKFNNQKS